MSTQPATVIPASLSPLEQPKPTHNGSLSPATSAAQRRRKKKNRTKTVIGGLLLLFSDITGELRLKAQYNAQIQVQQATLDKLSDAVAVFGSDGRLRLHNEAFCSLWNVSGAQLQAAGEAADEHSALAKAFCTVRMRETVGYARELLGGNGILLEHQVGRFVADAEAIYSYEGTREINTLVVGRAITGLSAFV